MREFGRKNRSAEASQPQLTSFIEADGRKVREELAEVYQKYQDESEEGQFVQADRVRAHDHEM